MTKQEMMKELTETVSHPKFESLVREIEAQPEKDRLPYAQKFATVAELKKRGVPLNDQFRICIRTFEDSKEPSDAYDKIFSNAPADVGSWTICASLGYVLCVTVGYTE
ncbi:hypothetical protein SAMN05443429_10224 [Cruoricaptor ignavus]|uniref:Uncharacterized protein n=1 Tax=Cruoricaptor ignavus TaxID=1118202 RepID=A0A1M6BJQ7_9FLAO|nr:hypothetical protein [Cruoricaptor ignavus]SHI48723.1 hypothetical protein SAMN05443429_10224 [Cruoricaptor ignavus]